MKNHWTGRGDGTSQYSTAETVRPGRANGTDSIAETMRPGRADGTERLLPGEQVTAGQGSGSTSVLIVKHLRSAEGRGQARRTGTETDLARASLIVGP